MSPAPVKWTMYFTGQAKAPQYHLPELRGRQRRQEIDIDFPTELFYIVKQSIYQETFKMKTTVVRARVPESLKRDFEVAAATHGWNLSNTIRRLMRQYVAQEKELAQRQRETMEAIEDIAAGRVVDGDKVMDWLDGWGSDDEQALLR